MLEIKSDALYFTPQVGPPRFGEGALWPKPAQPPARIKITRAAGSVLDIDRVARAVSAGRAKVACKQVTLAAADEVLWETVVAVLDALGKAGHSQVLWVLP